jgi:hypothetical protein
MGPYTFVVLFVVAILAVWSVREPPQFTKVKQLYADLRLRIKNDLAVPEKFRVLKREILLIGYLKKKKELGYNTNKGYEICLCLDGTPNQIFHVLLHELAHSTVKEYDHNETFWKNFRELRELAAGWGLYQPISSSEEFCGKSIKD